MNLKNFKNFRNLKMFRRFMRFKYVFRTQKLLCSMMFVHNQCLPDLGKFRNSRALKNLNDSYNLKHVGTLGTSGCFPKEMFLGGISGIWGILGFLRF